MEKIQKNIEDERMKCLLLGFGMGLGFVISLYSGHGNTKKQAAKRYLPQQKNKSIAATALNIRKAKNFESDVKYKLMSGLDGGLKKA